MDGEEEDQHDAPNSDPAALQSRSRPGSGPAAGGPEVVRDAMEEHRHGDREEDGDRDVAP